MEQHFKGRRFLVPKDKKGLGVSDIYPIMLTIGLVAILIAIVLMVVGQVGEEVSTTSFSVTNESAFVNITGSKLGHYNSSTCGFNTPTTTAAWANVSGTPYIISTSNYTLTGNYLYNDSLVPNSTEYNDANVSYTYLAGGTACGAIVDIQKDIFDFIPWIGIILLVVAAAIVLTILIRNLAGGSSRV